MKMAVFCRSLRPAGEDRAVDKTLDLLGFDAAVLQQPIDAAIGGDDGVEDAGVRIGVELEEDLW